MSNLCFLGDCNSGSSTYLPKGCLRSNTHASSPPNSQRIESIVFHPIHSCTLLIHPLHQPSCRFHPCHWGIFSKQLLRSVTPSTPNFPRPSTFSHLQLPSSTVTSDFFHSDFTLHLALHSAYSTTEVTSYVPPPLFLTQNPSLD